MKTLKLTLSIGAGILAIAILSTLYQRKVHADFQAKAVSCCPVKVGDALEHVRATLGSGLTIGMPGLIPVHEGLSHPQRKISHRCELFAIPSKMPCDVFLSGGYFIYFDHNNTVEYIYFGHT